MRLELRSGRSYSFLICSRGQNTNGFFVEGVAGPSDQDEDMIPCSHCKSPHYVVSLTDAIEEERLDLQEASACVLASKVVALTLRDLEAIAKACPQRKGRR